MALPFADVLFANDYKYPQLQPIEVLIRQKEYAHDAAVVTIEMVRGRALQKYQNGQPVTIHWGYLPGDTDEFRGYVHHTETVQRSDKPPLFKVYCIGASYRFKQPHRRSFKRMNAGAIVRSIVKQNRFMLNADPTSRFHNHIPQLGRSDWDFLVHLAKDIGFTLHCYQTTVRFKRRVIDKTGRVPVFSLTPGVYRQQNALRSINHKAGSAPYAEHRVIQVDGIDDQGRPLTLVDAGDCCNDFKPVFKQWVDTTPVTSQRQGNELLAGLSGMQRFYVIASATMSGAARLRPGRTIAITGAGPEVDGRWWVGGLDHVITPRDYTCHATLGRESLTDTTFVAPPASPTGKPELIDEPGIETVAAPDTPSEYSPLDDCTPVEELQPTAFGESAPMLPPPDESPAQRRIRRRFPRPDRERGCCPPDVSIGTNVTMPRLHGWRSSVPVEGRA